MSFLQYKALDIIGGTKENKTEQLLSDAYSPESRDVYLDDQEITTRKGCLKHISTQLSGAILHQYIYKKFTGSWYYILFTPKDIYHYDQSASIVNFITPKYSTGTVDVTNGSAVVAGNGTTWSTNVKAGDYLRLGGLNDVSAVWYEIQSVDSDTQVTLTANYTETTQSSQAYTIRKVFTTEDSDTWRCDQFTDSSLGDIMVATNSGGSAGTEKMVYWDGSNQVQEVSGGYVCKDVITFKGRVIAVNTYEGGAWQTQRYRWSDVADVTTYGATAFQDIVDTPGGFVGGIKLENSNYLVLFKDDSKFLIRWIGGDYVFEYELINTIGSNAPHSIEVVPNIGVTYYGSDLKFHIYNGLNDTDISSDIWNFINNITPDNWHKIYTKYIDYNDQIRTLISIGSVTANNYCVVYDKNHTDKGRQYFNWYVWEYKKDDSMGSLGEFWNITDYYVDVDPWKDRYVDEWDGYWDAREYLDNSPLTMMGGEDGYIRQVDIGLDDDGETYTPYFVSKRLDFKLPSFIKRLWKLVMWMRSETGQTVDVYTRDSDKIDWNAAVNIDIDDTDKDVVKKPVTVNRKSDVFDVKVGGTPPWTLIGFIAWIKKLNKIL